MPGGGWSRFHYQLTCRFYHHKIDCHRLYNKHQNLYHGSSPDWYRRRKLLWQPLFRR